jgi:hypothetical protein
MTADFQRISFDNAVSALAATTALKASESAPELVNPPLPESEDGGLRFSKICPRSYQYALRCTRCRWGGKQLPTAGIFYFGEPE